MIGAKATAYKGINFRSRLEARWAAFFDIAGWTWEYEPECDGAYIPDFLLHGLDERRVFVEVKPMDVYLGSRVSIVSKARNAIGPVDDLLILTGDFIDGDCWGHSPVFGFMPVTEDSHSHSHYYHDSDEHARLFEPSRNTFDFAHTWGSWAGRLTGVYEGNALYEGTLVHKAELLKLWSRAGNAIQWKPRANA